MANEFRTLDSHSAEYFGDTRDYWWNLDFLELIGKRLSFDHVQDVLDVGSGVGHWGQLTLASKALIAIRFGSKRLPRAPLLMALRIASHTRSLSPKNYRSPTRASIS